MGEQRSLINALLLGKRVDFTTRTGYLLLKVMQLSLLFGALLVFLLFVNRDSSLTMIVMASLTSALLILTFVFLRRNLIIASIKSDMLIIRTMRNKTMLTSISTVRGLRTINLGMMHLTTFEYFLDGSYRPVIMITSSAINPVTPAKSILKAQEIQENKKANHKPDSVLIAS